MKSLFQRIKPEVLIEMYKDQEVYPALVNSTTKELKETFAICDVKIGTASRLFSYATKRVETFDEIQFYKLFNK